jgi:fatty acid desaturase
MLMNATMPAPALPNAAAPDAEDRDLLRAAAAITKEARKAQPAIYWGDTIASAVVGYGSLIALVNRAPDRLSVLLFAVAVLALYRAESFIHELTHVLPGRLPGFNAGWNALVGIPLLTPSFMYEGVHNQHHLRHAYGTPRDPEYKPLAQSGWLGVVGFTLLAALAPVALILRFAVLAPLSLLIPPLREAVVSRFSALAINPDYRRSRPKPEAYRRWLVLETLASIWAMTMVALVAKGVVSLRTAGMVLAVLSMVALVNQIRTLAAHMWQNDSGEPMSLTAQYADSVNVPPPRCCPRYGRRWGCAITGCITCCPRCPITSWARRIKGSRPSSGAGRAITGAITPACGRWCDHGSGRAVRPLGKTMPEDASKAAPSCRRLGPPATSMP